MSDYRRTVLVFNPQSRNGTASCAEVVDRLLPLGPVHVFQADETNAARDAILQYGSPQTRVVLGGGDGTLSSLVEPIIETESTLGVLPLGTANDFARSLQIPFDVAQAVDKILDAEERVVDVGDVGGRLFLNAVGVGLGPDMTHEMDDETKSSFGVLAYPLALLSALSDPQTFRAQLQIDGQQHSLDCLQVTIANGVHYGGGMTVADAARVDNGELTVLCILRQPTWQLASHALTLRTGASGDEEDINLFRGKEVRLETTSRMEVTADGDPVGNTPVHCRVKPASLKVFAPSATVEAA